MKQIMGLTQIYDSIFMFCYLWYIICIFRSCIILLYGGLENLTVLAVNEYLLKQTPPGPVYIPYCFHLTPCRLYIFQKGASKGTDKFSISMFVIIQFQFLNYDKSLENISYFV